VLLLGDHGELIPRLYDHSHPFLLASSSRHQQECLEHFTGGCEPEGP
jgi:hypothetical protein